MSAVRSLIPGIRQLQLVTPGHFLTLNRMQYQPSPRKHTQNIFLAMSIIYDMRFHKPRELPRRADEDGLEPSTRGLKADEVRALVGLYSVASW